MSIRSINKEFSVACKEIVSFIISSGNRDPYDAVTVSADADCTVPRKPMVETVVVIVDKRLETR